MMKVLVTGSEGQLGSETVRLLSPTHDVIAASRRDLDVTDHAAVAALMSHLRPGAVVNCAASNDVGGAEDDPLSSIKVVSNLFTPWPVVSAAAENVPTRWVCTQGESNLR